jgi:hypothetical protein
MLALSGVMYVTFPPTLYSPGSDEAQVAAAVGRARQKLGAGGNRR